MALQYLFEVIYDLDEAIEVFSGMSFEGDPDEDGLLVAQSPLIDNRHILVDIALSL